MIVNQKSVIVVAIPGFGEGHPDDPGSILHSAMFVVRAFADEQGNFLVEELSLKRRYWTHPPVNILDPDEVVQHYVSDDFQVLATHDEQLEVMGEVIKRLLKSAKD